MHIYPEVTIFGSSASEEGTEAYEAAYEIAKMLTEAGYQVKNGGYYGTMEASSKGALECGRAAVGITMKSFDPKKQNMYCKPEKKADIFERLKRLVSNSKIIVVLPGQLGTMTEFFLVWEMLESNQINPKPHFICIGKNWKNLIDQVMNIQNIKAEDRKLVTICNNTLAFKEYLYKIKSPRLNK